MGAAVVVVATGVLVGVEVGAEGAGAGAGFDAGFGAGLLTGLLVGCVPGVLTVVWLCVERRVVPLWLLERVLVVRVVVVVPSLECVVRTVVLV